MEYNYKIYTPDEYAIDMAAVSLENYLINNPKINILELKIIDISCGSGNLLLAILENLILRTKKVFGNYEYNENWITGLDTDHKALELFKNRFNSLMNKYNLIGSLNVKLCDSLLENFDEIYDIVIGNPPYLGEKNNKELFQKIKFSDFGKKYYTPKMDYFYFFIAKGIDILKENGILVYLTTNYWLKADSANEIRKKIKLEGEFFRIENFNQSLFKTALGQHNIIFYWKKSKTNSDILIKENFSEYYISQKNIFSKVENKIILVPPDSKNIINNIIEKSNTTLGELVNVNQGIVSGSDKAFIFENFKEEFKKYLKPFYKNKDIGKYTVSEKPPFWILYLNSNNKPDVNILKHLSIFKEKLEQRREVIFKRIKWWQLQWARDEDIFLKPKIIVRQRCKTNNFAYTENPFYGSADIYYLTAKNKNVNLFYLLGYLNSNLFLSWFNYIGKRKGVNLEFYSTPLKETPIYYPENINDILYIENLVKLQIENFSEETQQKINNYFKKIYF